MTNYQALTQYWQAAYEVAPDLLAPITNDQALAQATSALRSLSREIKASGLEPHPLANLVELVTGRIMAYEAQHYPVPDADGPMMLAFYLDQKGLTQQQLSGATGINQATISQLLNRKRPFTLGHARKLATYFGVKLDMFL